MANLGNTNVFGNLVVTGVSNLRDIISTYIQTSMLAVKKDNTDIVRVDQSQCDEVMIMELKGRAPYLPNLYSGTGANLVISNTDGQLLKDSSSSRYKDNIRPCTHDTSKVLDLEVKEYEYKTSGDYNRSPIAEEAILISEDYVMKDAQGRPDALYTTRIMYDLLEEVKKMRKEIDDFKATL